MLREVTLKGFHFNAHPLTVSANQINAFKLIGAVENYWSVHGKLVIKKLVRSSISWKYIILLYIIITLGKTTDKLMRIGEIKQYRK